MVPGDGGNSNRRNKLLRSTSSARLLLGTSSAFGRPCFIHQDSGTFRNAEEENPDDWVKGEDEAEISAVTKIQAAFRGHKVRKSMAGPAEPTKADLEAEFPADDPEVIQAATKIQATFRGHMSRKKPEDEISEKMEKLAPKADEEELDIDLSDPDLHKAATKIQASFRGHKVRKDEPKQQ